MIAGILFAVVLGVFAGVITGIIPGIHVNLVSVLVVASSSYLLSWTSPVVLCSFIISLAITHTFIDSIPSIYLGAPDPDNALTVLPGHRMLFQGKGHLAVKMTVIGSLMSLFLGALLFPAFIPAMRLVYPFVRGWIGYILMLIMLFMVMREPGIRRKTFALLAFLFSGLLGATVLEMPGLNQPLFSLLSGLFGLSLLLASLMHDSSLPQQEKSAVSSLGKGRMLKAGALSTSTGFVAAFLPGFGSSQAAILAQNFAGRIGDEGFLALVGGINTANMLISLATAYVLSKARNGAIVGVTRLMGEVSRSHMLVFLAVCIVAGSAAAILALAISRKFSDVIAGISYRKTALSIICFIAFLSVIFDGHAGLLVLATSASLGFLSGLLGIGKNHLMGCLIVPVILYFIM